MIDSVIEGVIESIYIVVGVLFTAGAFLALYRIVRGPTILDRVIASDVLLTTLILVVGAEMVYNGHTRTVPMMLVMAATAIFGTITVARYVSTHDGPGERGLETIGAIASGRAAADHVATTTGPISGIAAAISARDPLPGDGAGIQPRAEERFDEFLDEAEQVALHEDLASEAEEPAEDEDSPELGTVEKP